MWGLPLGETSTFKEVGPTRFLSPDGRCLTLIWSSEVHLPNLLRVGVPTQCHLTSPHKETDIWKPQWWELSQKRLVVLFCKPFLDTHRDGVQAMHARKPTAS